MKGYIYITSSGYDPEKGKVLNDPYLGETPTLGACMPNIRKQVVAGDYIFVVSGKVPGVQQFVVGGFEVAEKIDALAAFKRFPNLRLHETRTGDLQGNVIVTKSGNQHRLDQHRSFEERIKNYVVGRNPLVLTAPEEIVRGRKETLEVLSEVLARQGPAPINVVGRWSKLDRDQVMRLHHWLLAIKNEA